MKTYRVYTTLDVKGKIDNNVPKFVKAYNRNEAWEKAKLNCSGTTGQQTDLFTFEPLYLQFFHNR